MSNELWKHACVAGRANIHIFMFRLDMDLDGTLGLEELAAALAWVGQCRRLVLDPVLAHPRRMLERLATVGTLDRYVGRSLRESCSVRATVQTLTQQFDSHTESNQ